MLQTTPNHNVKTFILLSSPQAGQFGGLLHIYGIKIDVDFKQHTETDFLSWIIPNVATELVYK